MAVEIERKFLVLNDDWRTSADQGRAIRQGYLAGNERSSVRVRVDGDVANINIKSATLGIRRLEYEYTIPIDDANEMLNNLCQGAQIEKTRYHVDVSGHLWEVDVFAGNNQGLVVAEIELSNEDEVFPVPSWAGEDVSHDPRYYNVSLIKDPYKDW
jgi:adenylate cyclase